MIAEAVASDTSARCVASARSTGGLKALVALPSTASALVNCEEGFVNSREPLRRSAPHCAGPLFVPMRPRVAVEARAGCSVSCGSMVVRRRRLQAALSPFSALASHKASALRGAG